MEEAAGVGDRADKASGKRDAYGQPRENCQSTNAVQHSLMDVNGKVVGPTSYSSRTDPMRKQRVLLKKFP